MAKYQVKHGRCGSLNVQSCQTVINCYKILVNEQVLELSGRVEIQNGDLEETEFYVDEYKEDDFFYCNECNKRVDQDELLVEEVAHPTLRVSQ